MNPLTLGSLSTHGLVVLKNTKNPLTPGETIKDCRPNIAFKHDMLLGIEQYIRRGFLLITKVRTGDEVYLYQAWKCHFRDRKLVTKEFVIWFDLDSLKYLDNG